MDKTRVLDSVSALVAAGDLSEAELLTACRQGGGSTILKLHTRISTVSSFVGAGVVFLGVVALISQYWNVMGSGMRVVVSLGSGIAAFATGVILSRRDWFGAAGPACFLIAAAILPSGLVVLLDEAGFQPDQVGWQSLISVVLVGVFTAAYLLFRSNSLLIPVIAFATWAFFAITSWIANQNSGLREIEFFEYRALVVGLTFIVLAFAFSETPRRPLSGFLYGLGAVTFLGAALALGGSGSNRSVVWGLIFPILAVAVLGASLYLGSKALLTFGSLFFAFFLTQATTEYFKGSIGWPLILVVFGMSLMVVGFVTFRLKRRYLNE